MDPGRARLHRRHRRGGREAEVVVPVPVHWDVRPEPVPHLADEKCCGLRGCDPERVDDDHLRRACVDSRFVRLAEEVDLRAARVHTEIGDADSLFRRERHRRADPLEHRLPGDSDRCKLPVRDGALDDRGAQPQLDERLDVGEHGAGEAPDLGVEPRLEE